eukprot:scaffold3286_cov129-Isochrysis_galbana.AAC.2
MRRLACREGEQGVCDGRTANGHSSHYIGRLHTSEATPCTIARTVATRRGATTCERCRPGAGSQPRQSRPRTRRAAPRQPQPPARRSGLESEPSRPSARAATPARRAAQAGAGARKSASLKRATGARRRCCRRPTSDSAARPTSEGTRRAAAKGEVRNGNVATAAADQSTRLAASRATANWQRLAARQSGTQPGKWGRIRTASAKDGARAIEGRTSRGTPRAHAGSCRHTRRVQSCPQPSPRPQGKSSSGDGQDRNFATPRP